MWGRKDEETPPAAPETRTSAQPAAPSPTAKLRAAVASTASDSARAQAQIGKSLKLKGEITGSEDLTIDGEVEGTVELKENNLTVGPNGNVRANVRARSISVLGRLEGNVNAGERVEIRKTGSLEGDVVTPRILIEDGAVFRGSIDILKGGELAGGEKKFVKKEIADEKKGAAVPSAPTATPSSVNAPKT